MKIHEKYMKRCLELAKNGLPNAMPNPSVGAVIVCDDKIVGEGYTSAYGGPHAEANAIRSVKDQSLLKKSTLYVSLEPCSHFGKTPPCCDLIIKHEIPTIIVGTVDTNSKVSGTGIQKIIASGKTVIIGVLEQECIESNKRFFTFHNKKRPYIILKWAQSQDGFIAPTNEFRKDLEANERKPYWISNTFSRQLVHKWRSEEQAILVGTQTVIDDNPKLDVRDWTGKNPVKIVLDQRNRISKENYIFGNTSKTIVLTANEIDYTQKIGKQIADFLFDNAIQSVIIEGGRQTLQTFIDENLWDEARVFKGSILIENGVKAPELHSKETIRKSILEDELLIFRNHD
ncbi:bifunctional diaminohydroxyphosphoribosylaminopyrimidine deaminase/5-amino-6-(5-phosphoribosylamino)uracil reductase RibD [Flavobacterium sp.]|uniref:bifunctional diaminohydroxyphosphoribosylaminopyrimidine deaminase/5-amino-6-(5-phosphoribosylamino)uracil reductase RibD n=1 Tax=Flavobacterium sp. TaxID=239 RepID=UPI00286C8608|nr:bifunctional diaminohydroxyphosphoribosylaminopyrimidine deaminase/5-amino-6-(5-phosphoribosylamino)uracil reductase RibD [Flavobacterium sp.]